MSKKKNAREALRNRKDYSRLGHLANHYGYYMHKDMCRLWNAADVSLWSLRIMQSPEFDAVYPDIDVVVGMDRYHEAAGDFWAWGANNWSDV